MGPAVKGSTALLALVAAAPQMLGELLDFLADMGPQ